MEEVVIVSASEYENLVRDSASLGNYLNLLQEKDNEISKLKNTLMKVCENQYNIKGKTDCDDIEGYNFGLDKKTLLLNCLSIEEMQEYIRNRKKAYEKLDKESEEGI